MLKISDIILDYEENALSIILGKKEKSIGKRKYKFYVKHKDEIDEAEILSDKVTKEDLPKFLLSHRSYYIYLKYIYLQATYKSLSRSMRKNRISKEKNKCYVIVKFSDEKRIKLVELCSNEELDITGLKPEYITYLNNVLEKDNSFICEINEKELSLVKVSFDDCFIKDRQNDDEFIRMVRNNVASDVVIARSFDNRSSEGNDGESIQKALKKCNRYKNLYEKGKVSLEKYLIKYYIYNILSTRNVELIYELAPLDQKELVIKAYMSLSGDIDETDFYIRTTSKIINDEVIRIRSKKNKNQN